MKLFQKRDLILQMAQLALIPHPHRSSHHYQAGNCPSFARNLVPLIDPNSTHLVPSTNDLFLNRAWALPRFMLDNKNFRHIKTIRNTILLRNNLSSIS